MAHPAIQVRCKIIAPQLVPPSSFVALSKAAQGSAVLDQVAVLNYISPSTAFVMRARNFGQIAVMT
jgi:hypothetical protein